MNKIKLKFKTHSLKLDFKKRTLYVNKENNHITYNALIKNQILPLSVKYNLLEKGSISYEFNDKNPLSLIPTSHIRNRCLLTGRSRGNLPKYGLSRIMFTELASEGLIPGMTSKE